jgi:hypothetical protein
MAMTLPLQHLHPDTLEAIITHSDEHLASYLRDNQASGPVWDNCGAVQAIEFAGESRAVHSIHRGWAIGFEVADRGIIRQVVGDCACVRACLCACSYVLACLQAASSRDVFGQVPNSLVWTGAQLTSRQGTIGERILARSVEG